MLSGPLGISACARRLRQTTLRDYLVRFVFGGATSVAAGAIAARFGPGVGGLFLAFPAILPASLTLLARHTRSARAAGADAYGSLFGSIGMLVFAALIWLLGGQLAGWLVLMLAMLAWSIASCGSWALAEHLRRRRGRRGRALHLAPERVRRVLTNWP